jgi:hypothetical protein
MDSFICDPLQVECEETHWTDVPGASAEADAKAQCGDWNGRHVIKNVLSMHLATWRVGFRSCGNGVEITEVSGFEVVGQTHMVGWSWHPGATITVHLPEERTGKSLYTVKSTGKFTVCFTKWGCIRESRPRLVIEVTAANAGTIKGSN